jgi:hypothetical protein
MITYEIRKSIDDMEFIVRTNEDGSESWIPTDEANSDYQEYLNPSEATAQ